MPAVTTSSKVLLTGGTGFLGTWILKELLERGFTVRAAVRSDRKANHLRKQFEEHVDRLEFTTVGDITKPGTFDEAVDGVDAIIHCASPLIPEEPGVDPNVVIEPAVNGTVGILKSALKSPTVKRAIITSSVGTIYELSTTPTIRTEENWNNSIIKVVEQYGKDAPPIAKYAASKTLAERSVWSWAKEANPSFGLVTVQPSFIWGEVISETTADIKGSNTMLLDPLKSEYLKSLTDEQLLAEITAVDVREVVKLHVDALLLPNVEGQRFICHAKTVTVQHILDILNAEPVEGIVVPTGKPELLKGWVAQVDYSNQKSKDTFGIQYRPIEETIHNTLIHALQLGWHQ